MSSSSAKRQRNESDSKLVFNPTDLDLPDIEFMRKILEKRHSKDDLCEYIFKMRQHHVRSHLIVASPPAETPQPSKINKLPHYPPGVK